MQSGVTGRRFAPNPAISWTDNGGALLLFDHEQGRYHSLNPWASDLWRLIACGAGEAEVVTSLIDRYDAAPAVISADVADFVSRALASGLVVERP